MPDFSIYVASCRVENRAKKAQNGTVSASQLVKASQNAIFFSTQQISIVLLYCVQSLVGKGRFLATKRTQKRVCIVGLASAAILPFLVTSPDIQFWLSAALEILALQHVAQYPTNRTSSYIFASHSVIGKKYVFPKTYIFSASDCLF